MFRLLGGKIVDTVDWSSPAFLVHLKEMHEYVHDLFEDTVAERLEKWYADVRTSFDGDSKWLLHPTPKRFKFSTVQVNFFKKAITHLAQLCLQNPVDFEVYHRASLDRGYGSNCRSSHERLENGDIIQLLLMPGSEQHTFINSSHNTRGVPHFFVIGGFFRSTNGEQWAVVRHCELLFPHSLHHIPQFNETPIIEVSTKPFYHMNNHYGLRFLSLTSNVVKVGVLHNCEARNGTCDFSTATNSPIHFCDTLSGGRFFLLTRSMAYPPRRS